MAVAALSVATPSVAPYALRASVCDEQFVGVGGEIALSGNILRLGFSRNWSVLSVFSVRVSHVEFDGLRQQ